MHEWVGERCGVSALEQYALLFGMVVATVGLALTLGVISRSLGRVRQEKAKDVPATSGELSPEPVWVRYHVRYYGYALLFLAFDMEMAFMYPWAVVFKELGLVALLDMGVFLMVLFLGLLYGWSQGALRRQ
ncbi:MAG: NADH ubiquinone oxidoreductase chain A [uncultured Rubrobacteraceae bacterium]|uniref:NADH-quinone oxidoreductase subunit n=1 Tax=uncultured Rubrobacteraceae bacterium TaxID=349277 RepID=A0A6J4Q2D8_9ACTN|nr:MAG: NADH ubiquinone oxidoreductase chain A [uncultured Rubrobacteraceae bacterium]